jgi:plasmid stabilization system protein ParE
MAHDIRITELAFLDIDEIVAHIAQNAALAAANWQDRILTKIESLQNFPLRHGLAPEAEAAGAEIRQTFLGVYRILYRVKASTVEVLGVRHGARLPLRPEELPDC